jgi:hypothetical protein
MFTGWVTAMITLQQNDYTVAISSVNKIVINEWLQLNNSGFLMCHMTSTSTPSLLIFCHYRPTLPLPSTAAQRASQTLPRCCISQCHHRVAIFDCCVLIHSKK